MADELDPQGTETQALLNAVDFNKAQVLEVGCGDGRLTFRYGNFPAFVVGLEPKANPLAAAIDACPFRLRQHVSFVQASAMALPFRADAFDIVLMAKSL